MTEQTRIDPHDVFAAMERYGGGFVSHLAKAWRRADSMNAAKLMDAFADYYDQYEAQVRRDRQSALTPADRRLLVDIEQAEADPIEQACIDHGITREQLKAWVKKARQS